MNAIQSLTIRRDESGRYMAGSGAIHGMSNTPEYRAWDNMIARCYRRSNPYFESYGGRGIQVCTAWLDSFENFFSDIGSRPSKGYSVDRIDPDGNYEPGNVRWASLSVQSFNKRMGTRNTSGATGVSWDKRRCRYRAYIGVDRRRIELGLFDSLEEAISVRHEAELRFYG